MGMTSNYLILMSDEHQAGAMGCAEHPLARTPNLDSLAARGTRFTNAYTPSPICVPARACFATGRHVHQTRLWDNAMPYDGTIPGWGHALQANGVPVESIGKLHYRSEEDPVGFDAEHLPMMVADGVGMVWASIRKEDERVLGTGRMLGDYIGPGQSPYTDYDAAVTDRTRQWFKDRAAGNERRPWCLYVGLVAPHFPLVVPQDYYDLYPLDDLPESKLRPRLGYDRHPWVERQSEFMDNEAKFTSEYERKSAIASYLGLCSWLDNNVGEILGALDEAGFGQDTTIVYTSDHGENLGARGLWGKSNLYQESASIPLILAGPDIPKRVCETPVSLLDLSHSIAHHFGADFETGNGSLPLPDIAGSPTDPDRIVFSQYHAAGAVSGAFMLRKGRWKYHCYIGFPPELFDLETDPDESTNLAQDAQFADILKMMDTELRQICDPEATDAQAFADQEKLIEKLGGRNVALGLGAPGATPPPSTE